jgi:exosome complex component RRP42
MSASTAAGASSAEVAYTLAGAAHDLREDGRARLDYRHLSLELSLLPQTSGSARLRSGDTEVLVGVVAVLAEPDAATPDSGRISVAVGCGPGDGIAAGLPEYAADGALSLDEKRLWLESALAQLYGPKGCPAALRTLCIVAGRQCWELRVHVQLLRADGCPLDAACLAVCAALAATRVPRVAVNSGEAEDAGDGGGGGDAPLDLDLDESLDESVPFDASTLPLYVTLASLDGHLVADCTAKERRAAGSALSLALDADGNLAALCGGGTYGLHMTAFAAAMTVARQLCAELHVAAAAAISAAADAAELRAAGAGGLPADAAEVGFAGRVLG